MPERFFDSASGGEDVFETGFMQLDKGERVGALGQLDEHQVQRSIGFDGMIK